MSRYFKYSYGRIFYRVHSCDHICRTLSSQPKNNANFIPLTPLSLLERAVRLYPDRTVYITINPKTNEDVPVTWEQFDRKMRRISSSLVNFGIKPLDVISMLAPNCPLAFDAHFAVMGARAILHSLNIRLDPTSIAFQLKHSKSKLLLVDTEFIPLAVKSLDILKQSGSSPCEMPRLIVIEDPAYSQNLNTAIHTDYAPMSMDQLLQASSDSFEYLYPHDEWDPVTLNYTSGTTGDPKGVVYHHRGAYLNCVSNALDWHMSVHPKFLWVVPLFHANGWCFPWTLAALGGSSYFLRQIRAEALYSAISKYQIQYMVGAPITMNTMLSYDGPLATKYNHRIEFLTAGSPPPPSVMQRFVEKTGIRVCTAYGLTEVFGPVTRCHAHIEDRNGDGGLSGLLVQTPTIGVQDIKVLDRDTYEEVPPDGKTIGEVMIRGNAVMKGYFANEKATEECFARGWFHSGDMAVNHGRGTFEIKDRYKDIIISGGENISSVEIENIFLRHKSISEAAVVAMKDEKWGEVPAIFVTLHLNLPPEQRPTASELLAWGRTMMASFQAPKLVRILEALPKNVTGKVQKYVLRGLLNQS